MIELPEAAVLSKQLDRAIRNKKIRNVIAGHTKHKLAWFYGNPEEYLKLLKDKNIDKIQSHGGLVEISAGNANILYGDGINLCFNEKISEIPFRHQLLIEFTDNTYLCASVQMYGGAGCFKEGELDNKYYLIAKEKPSPLSAEFNKKYFDSIITNEKTSKLSLKALLATEQRIPGLGNGVLQDILFNAHLHPKKRIDSINENQVMNLFNSIKKTLKDMTDHKGRNTEKDLFGQPGEYVTKMSKNTVGKPCIECGTLIEKANYMGGSVYFCPECQVL